LSREQAVKRLVKMLKDLIAKADKEGVKLAPFIGIACPGVIKSDITDVLHRVLLPAPMCWRDLPALFWPALLSIHI
jgi:hypothetical protein